MVYGAIDPTTDSELWDIKDKAPVVRPDDDNAGPTDPITDGDINHFVEALRAMPVALQLRWIRCIQTMEVLERILAHSFAPGGFYHGKRMQFRDDVDITRFHGTEGQ